MMKKLLLLLLLVFTSNVFAQQGFNYKAVIYDNNNPVQNQSIEVKFTVFENISSEVYQETQTTTTDSNGIIILSLGEGTVTNGDFSTINWNMDTFLKVEIDKGAGFQDMGTSQFNYVPLAKYADKAGNTFSGDFNDLNNVPSGLSDGDDNTQLTETQVDNFVANNGYLTNEVDGSTTNELQTISKVGNTVTLSNGGGSFTDTDTDTQLTETQVDDFVANNGYLTTEVDGSTTNELQSLSVSGNQLSITNGNTVTLPTGSGGDQWGSQVVETNTSINGDGTSSNPLNINTNSADFNGWDKNASDDFDGEFSSLNNVPSGLSDGDDDTQLTETQVDNFVANNGYLTSEVDGSITNELQTISKVGNTVTLSNGGGSFTDTDTDTQLTETQVDNFVANNGYLTNEVDGSTTNELQTISKVGNIVTLSNGGGSFTDTDTQLTETQVDNFVANNGYLITSEAIVASAQEGFNYKAIIYDNGNPIQNQSVDLQFTILEDGTTGIYQETHITTTDANGIAIVNIGEGTVVFGDFTTIDWSLTQFIKVEVNIGAGYVLMGTTAFKYVPLAKYAEKAAETDYAVYADTADVANSAGSANYATTAGNVPTATSQLVNDSGFLTNEIDGDITNELQTLAISGNTLSISDGNSVTLPSSSGGTDVDFLEVGTGAAPNNILDNIYHEGNISIGHSATPTAKIDIYNTNAATEVNANTGIYIFNNNTSTSDKVGVKLTMTAPPTNNTAVVYGIKNAIADNGDSNIYGQHTAIGGVNGNGEHYGNYTSLYGEGSGTHTGSKVDMITNAQGSQIGYDVNITALNATNNQTLYGLKTKISGQGTGTKYAVSNLIDGDAEGYIFGIKNEISNTANGKHYGVYNKMTGTGTNSHYGSYTTISGTGSGNQIGYTTNNYNSGNGAHYGAHNFIYGSGSGEHIGVKNELSGAGTGNQIGVRNMINNTNGTNQYGVYTTLDATSGNGDRFATRNDLFGAGNGNLYGVRNQVSNSGSGVHSGTYNNIYGSGNGTHYGTRNVLSGSGTGVQYGSKTVIDNTGSGDHIGSQIDLSGGFGKQVGSVVNITASSDSGESTGYATTITGYATDLTFANHNNLNNIGGTNNIYGSYNNLISNNGGGDRYGLYSYINDLGNDNRYGVYSEIADEGLFHPGQSYAIYAKNTSQNPVAYAGWFEGDVKVTKKLKSEDSGDADMKAYIYGNIDADTATGGSIRASGSSDGFTMIKTGDGKYKIIMNHAASDAHSYIVITTLNDSLANIWVSNKTSSSFIVNIKQGIDYRNYDFQFVVYKR